MTAAQKYSLLSISYIQDCQDLFFLVCAICLAYKTINIKIHLKIAERNPL